ncbi:MAG: DUF4080 domain-containing protein [Verrucomicrobiia bacterium]
MSEIVLTTLNAKYIHASFGLRYLLANMGELKDRTTMVEFDINQRPLEIVERLLALNPKIIGFGIYIWNTTQSEEVIALIRRLAPAVKILLGGPEVSFDTGKQSIVELADYTITGEADQEFGRVCSQILDGAAPTSRVIPALLPKLADLELPYDLYTEEDLSHRVIYVEASRGCPFTCEFCLSSLDIPVRAFDLDRFLGAMEGLLQRGAKEFKFVDRTFNLNMRVSEAILEFFLERFFDGLFLHFEMIPDRLPEGLRELIKKFPPGALQFEVGIQTFNDEVSAHISRRQNYDKMADNFHFLRGDTGVHIHADLIVGLPGETLDSFGTGFDRLVKMRPQEIQIGILKRLKGTPIIRHDDEFKMIYSPHPPFEILSNRDLDFATFQRMRRFARYWDLVGNSGNFVSSRELIWAGDRSPFQAFLSFADYLAEKAGRRHGIALTQLVGFVFGYLTEMNGVDPELAASRLLADYQCAGRNDIPLPLRGHISEAARGKDAKAVAGPKRQSRHAAETVG